MERWAGYYWERWWRWWWCSNCYLCYSMLRPGHKTVNATTPACCITSAPRSKINPARTSLWKQHIPSWPSRAGWSSFIHRARPHRCWRRPTSGIRYRTNVSSGRWYLLATLASHSLRPGKSHLLECFATDNCAGWLGQPLIRQHSMARLHPSHRRRCCRSSLRVTASWHVRPMLAV